MVLMADPIWLLAPRPSSAVIRVRWVRPAVFAERERSFPSLPLTLVRLAIPFHRISFIVAHLLHARPFRVIFHRVRGRSHRIVSSSVCVIGCRRPTVVGCPRGRRTRKRLWLAARPRWDAMGGHSRVAALLMLRRSSLVLGRSVALHLGSIVASLRRCRGAASGIVRSRLIGRLRSPKRRKVCRGRVHPRGRVNRRAIRRTRRGSRRRWGVVRLLRLLRRRLRGLSEGGKATAKHRRDGHAAPGTVCPRDGIQRRQLATGRVSRRLSRRPGRRHGRQPVVSSLMRRRVLTLMTSLLLLGLRARGRLLRRGARGRHGAIHGRRRGRDGRGALVSRVARRRQAVALVRIRAVLHVVGRRGRWIHHGVGWMTLVVKVSRGGRGGRMRRLVLLLLLLLLGWCGGKGWVVLWRIVRSCLRQGLARKG